MRRPIGVILIALFVIASSSMMLARALTSPGLRVGQRVLLASALFALLALVTAEELWKLRPHAFVTFTLWSLCAVAGLVFTRLALPSLGHRVELFGTVACAGLAYAVAALYLRRVV
jgi:hypothetical protein